MRWWPVVGVVLMLTACAPSASSGFDAAPSGASPLGASPSGSPDLSPRPSSAAPSPASTRFAFPSDFKVIYPAYKGDGEAAVRAFGDFWRAWWYAITAQGSDRRYQAFLPEIEPLSGLAVFPQTVASWRGEGVRPTGVLRARLLKAHSTTNGVNLVLCADESRVGTKSISSGAERWTFGQRATSRYQMRILMRQPDGGGWQVAAYMTDATVQECR
ncbi:hypothetical protein ACIBG8_23675 [Nonomuraea sp. NPDC050556]|uniref:hypothetical protein n=1 Tax=Nonomuraea sp. NPDC050556 TaxID=3364369 RepID=UPI00378FF85B